MMFYTPIWWRFVILPFQALLMAMALPVTMFTHTAFAAGQVIHLPQRSVAHIAVSRPSQGTVLYRADWSKGMNGWTPARSSGWVVGNGSLLNDGSDSFADNLSGAPTIIAPYNVPVADYAVEARIQVVRYNETGTIYTFGLAGRGTPGTVWKEYVAGADVTNERYGDKGFVFVGTTPSERVQGDLAQIGGSWHTYRIEFRGNDIKVLLDGSPITDMADNRYLSGKEVGLWCFDTQIQVSSFVVYTI